MLCDHAGYISLKMKPALSSETFVSNCKHYTALKPRRPGLDVIKGANCIGQNFAYEFYRSKENNIRSHATGEAYFSGQKYDVREYNIISM
jgi:hypothetical protein